jgi:hypothetical protein
VADLVKEASVLSGLRHPNIVWVYGLVLPGLTHDREGASQSQVVVEGPVGEVDAVSVATQAANRWGGGQEGCVHVLLGQGEVRGQEEGARGVVMVERLRSHPQMTTWLNFSPSLHLFIVPTPPPIPPMLC